ncbi:MAG: FliM/FliN family flagellar motor C-terminal domain-containing protein [Terracidiphilus sp.]
MAAQSQIAPQTPASGPTASQLSAEAALVQSPAVLGGEGALYINQLVSRLPVEVDVAVPIRKFRVRNLLALGVGSVIPSQWEQGEDMPLAARGAQLAWAEFEVIDQKLAVRITRLV